jgi:hypothetical protein
MGRKLQGKLNYKILVIMQKQKALKLITNFRTGAKISNVPRPRTKRV